jgi:PP-loop superfamily ATP-utilizing enzyme
MDNELLLFDRINVIKDTIQKYGEENFYLSFSGGKDSTILHYLLDQALPNERKQCETIWKPVYEKYRELNYRLKKVEKVRLW